MASDVRFKRPASHRALVAVVVFTVAAAVIGLIGAPLTRMVRVAVEGPDSTSPSCFWPVRIHGANRDQAGLIRCYQQALAVGSRHKMWAVVASREMNGPTGFAAADFAHAHDAASGPATVTVTPSQVDSAGATVDIEYADGAHDQLQIHLANPSSTHSWRFDIGSWPPDPSAPAPATH